MFVDMVLHSLLPLSFSSGVDAPYSIHHQRTDQAAVETSAPFFSSSSAVAGCIHPPAHRTLCLERRGGLVCVRQGEEEGDCQLLREWWMVVGG